MFVLIYKRKRSLSYYKRSHGSFVSCSRLCLNKNWVFFVQGSSGTFLVCWGRDSPSPLTDTVFVHHHSTSLTACPQARLPLLDRNICAVPCLLGARPVLVLHRMPKWQECSEGLTSIPQVASPASLRDSRLSSMRGLFQGSPVLSVSTSGRRDGDRRGQDMIKPLLECPFKPYLSSSEVLPWVGLPVPV